MNGLRKLWSSARRAIARRRYYLARLRRPKVSVRPIAYLPDGFSINRIAETGLTAVDNFCSPEEAAHLINAARERVQHSTVMSQGQSVRDPYRSSQNAHISLSAGDPVAGPLVYRAALLLGLPAANSETISITRYGAGDYYKGHLDYGKNFLVDRLYTVLLYLNDLEEDQGGGTLFRDLNVVVRPRLGRAVIWTNTEPDGFCHAETWHAALPTKGDGVEKWVVQMWFRAYRFSSFPDLPEPDLVRQGKPLQGDEKLPPGASIPSTLDESKLFGSPGG